MQLRLYNTLTRSIEDFVTADGSNTVRIYSCGPTVYNVAHLGNMRAFLAADLVQRTMRAVGGYQVRWVMNITDIDDKTIQNSTAGSAGWLQEMGKQTTEPLQNLRALTTYYTAQFQADLVAVGVNLEHFLSQPRATDYIPQMLALVNEIAAAGYAYESDGSVYFDVAAYSEHFTYGRLFAIDRENFKAGVRIDADEYDRESVSDFVLWKARKDNEPYWDLVWNDEKGARSLPGRPGWHLECSAMSRDLLGPLPFDIHTGGVDLRFPHHEDELAQCCAAHGAHTSNDNPFSEQANVWMHNEFLEVEGQKMSKSLGNFYTLRDLIHQGLDPLDIRLAMLGAHYRSVYNYTLDGVKAASAARRKVQEFIYQANEKVKVAGGDLHTIRTASIQSLGTPKHLQKVFAALANDVHTPKALAELYSWVGQQDVPSHTPDVLVEMLRELYIVNEVFAVWTFVERPIEFVPDDITALAELRLQARANTDWQESDRLRDVLLSEGWEVKDGKQGYELMRRQ